MMHLRAVPKFFFSKFPVGLAFLLLGIALKDLTAFVVRQGIQINLMKKGDYFVLEIIVALHHKQVFDFLERARGTCFRNTVGRD